MKPLIFNRVILLLPLLGIVGILFWGITRKKSTGSGQNPGEYLDWKTSQYILPYPAGKSYRVSQGNNYGGHRTLEHGACQYMFISWHKFFYTYNVHMNELRFEWDRRKEKANIKKHGVSFNEARAVFYDENAVQYFDPDHSEDEDCFILLGISYKIRILVVCHCFKESETVIGIISARKADSDEKNEYWRHRQ